MVEIISFHEIDAKYLVERIKAGDIFIYPTDTVYDLGCNALKSGSVSEIKDIMGRDRDKPLSVIAPSKKWIYDHFEISKKSYVQTLPGPFTFIFNMKKRAVARNVNPTLDTLGVRIPYHAFSRLVQRAGVPFITTSVNFSGKSPVREVSKISRNILKKVDFVIDDGFLHNQPSTIIDLTEEMPKIVIR
ncbi:threonylcarbamoyl-AMP synthase [Candidatus Woesearchaeota archaeon]|nr:threonylcarbamoyl-AMP synthase [Candidatus Woesearchaeota archaeon]MBT7237738.1 threonylcarbamoyl-AMP synthase [Candidatus Woesearchaeota archaeon]